MFKRLIQATFKENSQLGCAVLPLGTLAVLALFLFCGFYFGLLSR